jgi:hypothetical protein
MDNYFIWQFKSVQYACVLNDFTGFSAKNTLFHGISLTKSFPTDAAFHMDPDFPKNLLLTDNMLNSDSAMVVSAELADALRAQKVSKLEYLPVAIIDHKGKVASKNYSILNPLDLVDCIDREKSEFRPSRILPGEIDKFDKLVLDEARIPEDRPLFRMKGFNDIALASRALVDVLTKGNFTGLGWMPVSKYPRG